MSGLKKSPLKVSPGYFPSRSTSNPFDSDDELDNKQTVKPSRSNPSKATVNRPSFGTNPFDDELDNKQTVKPSRSTPIKTTAKPPNFGANPFDDELDNKQTVKPSRSTPSKTTANPSHLRTNLFDDGDDVKVNSSSSTLASTARSNYKNGFHDSGGIENQSVQELENYAVYQAEETTKSVHGCLKIAEGIREDATKTLITLHQQGEQITRTHEMAAGIDHELSRGEKLLGSLGGIFSKTWKPKKGRPIQGPVITRDDSPKRRGNHLEQREKLGLNPVPRGQSKSRVPIAEPADAYQKVEVEKAKQDDALSDLSGLLGELKNMAVDMGSEIERQSKGLDHLEDDVDELNIRVRGANQRARRLLGK